MTDRLFRPVLVRGILASMLTLHVGCWSSSDSESEEEMAATPGDEAAEASENAAKDTETSETAAREEGSTGSDAQVPPMAQEAPPESVAPDVPAPESSAPLAAPPPAASATGGVLTGATVQYVSAKVAPVYEKPDRSSQKVATLTRGDHILVVVEGEWAHTDDGRYIEAKHLSTKAIGKKKQPSRWK